MTWYERREPWQAQKEDAREAGDIDYARVIHSASFRRLQGKTQILNLGDSDFYRTRLTHSLEVAQIASGLTKQIAKDYSGNPICSHLPDRTLIQAIGCTHDLGHPPFGHGGEVALNYCMRDHGGFEGNGQTLRILSRLENFSQSSGANLSRRALLGVLKYPASFNATNNQVPALEKSTTTVSLIDVKCSKPPKCYLDSENDVVEWILKPLSDAERDDFQAVEQKADKHNKTNHKSLDCTIMDVADDISYGVHDLEDAIAMRLLTREAFENAVTPDSSTSFLDALKEKYPQECGNNVYAYFVDMLFGESATRKRCISRLIHHLITAIEVVEKEEFSEPLLRYRVQVKERQRALLDALQDVVRDQVILNPSIQHLEFKGQKMVVSVFEAMASDPLRLLPKDAKIIFEKSGQNVRVICDYVAGMTDLYLLKTYERLFSPRMGSVFDKL
ncbi:anti-phage deoxyguanosine triphosphatase [Pseudahrensia aquimaris]|uniref:Deoxyguanosinetriphosphate triphosphohydrolase-like protein n=1 Tax=Pseudahrensia aquimaris TaxID=744461 RepID=A0ABW3FK09_9HYPH